MFKIGKIFKWERKNKKKNEKSEEKEPDLVASLRRVVEESGLDCSSLQIAFSMKNGEKPKVEDRRALFVTDKAQCLGQWHIDSLAGLFRGDSEPPQDMDRYPEKYVRDFYWIESTVLLVHEFTQEETDDEYIRAYSLIRRRPEGRSEGLLHDAVYQASAFLLGTTPRSSKEFEAIIFQLERSVRHWKTGPASRNYIEYLKKSYSGVLKKKDPGAQRLIERVRGKDSAFKNATVLENPSGLRKASEIILDFADPFVEALKKVCPSNLHDEVRKNAIRLAVMVWNATLLPEGKILEAKRKIVSTLAMPESGKDFEGFLSVWFDVLLDRKRKSFASDK